MINFLYACLLTLIGVGLFAGLLLGLAYLTIYLTKGMK
jgi:hypothetical protein